MANDNKLIFIKTTRYSAFIKRIFEEYNTNLDIFIEGQHYSASDIPQIIDDWCKNDKIKSTIDFNIVRDGRELFGFHDTPDNFWASISEQSFIDRMAKDKIVKYRIYPQKTKSFILNKLFTLKDESKGFGEYAKENLAIQIIGGLICATVLDSGFTFNIWLISCLSYWVGFLFIRYRRPQSPSNIDIIFLQTATLIIFGIIWFGTLFGLSIIQYFSSK